MIKLCSHAESFSILVKKTARTRVKWVTLFPLKCNLTICINIILHVIIMIIIIAWFNQDKHVSISCYQRVPWQLKQQKRYTYVKKKTMYNLCTYPSMDDDNCFCNMTSKSAMMFDDSLSVMAWNDFVWASSWRITGSTDSFSSLLRLSRAVVTWCRSVIR